MSASPYSVLKYPQKCIQEHVCTYFCSPHGLRDPSFLSDTINLVTQGMSKNPIRTDSFQLGPFMKTFQSFLLGIFSIEGQFWLLWIYQSKSFIHRSTCIFVRAIVAKYIRYLTEYVYKNKVLIMSLYFWCYEFDCY